MANIMRVPSIQPNRLGWVNSLSYTDFGLMLDPFGIEATFMTDGIRSYIATPSSGVKVDLSMTVLNVPAVHEMLQQWMHEGISQPVFQKEFMCLYCASPNSIEQTHCKKCGGPRSFIIG